MNGHALCGTGWDDGIWFYATQEGTCGPFAGLSVFSVVGEASISSPDFVQPSCRGENPCLIVILIGAMAKSLG